MSKSTQLLAIARLGRAHGVHGAIKMIPFNQSSPLFVPGQKLYTDDAGNGSLYIESITHAGKNLIVTFASVQGRDQANHLTGTKLFIPMRELPPLENDEYYHFEIPGMAVVDGNGKRLGTCLELHTSGEVDVIEFECPPHENKHVPILKKFVRRIDREQRTVTLEISVEEL